MEPSIDKCATEFDVVASQAGSLLTKSGGGALCIYRDGQPVLDMWAGHSDTATGQPWERNTTAMSWSTTKGVASTAIHMLADRGHLSYDDFVGTHWPEYAVNGKERTTIRHVLAMEAGLYPIRPLIDDPRMMLDHDAMATALAAARPVHEPGTRNGYHAFTYGWIVGELVRRISGVSLGQFVRENIAEPLALDGFHVGTPAHEITRVAAFPDLKPETRATRTIAKAADPITSLGGFSPRRFASAFLPRDGNEVIATTDFLRAEVPGVNGVFTARSLAKFYAALERFGGVDGVQLWSPDTLRAASEQQNDRRDRVIPIRVRWLLGFHRPFPRKLASPSSFGFFGAYGSGAFADPDRGLAVGLVVQEAKGLPMSKLMGPIITSCG